MGKAFPPQLCPLCGERRRGWRAEAGLTLSSPGRCEQAGAAAAGAWGAGLSDGGGNDGQQDERDPADKGPALNSKAGSGKPSKRRLGCTSI